MLHGQACIGHCPAGWIFTPSICTSCPGASILPASPVLPFGNRGVMSMHICPAATALLPFASLLFPLLSHQPPQHPLSRVFPFGLSSWSSRPAFLFYLPIRCFHPSHSHQTRPIRRFITYISSPSKSLFLTHSFWTHSQTGPPFLPAP